MMIILDWRERRLSTKASLAFVSALLAPSPFWCGQRNDPSLSASGRDFTGWLHRLAWECASVSCQHLRLSEVRSAGG